ncbi:MAG: hypothetical protein NTZ18_04675 [Candidatus Komeilibacteria bacterium]|nr:hypothetical protein [Candidatus Komeilibacteria bacterium]
MKKILLLLPFIFLIITGCSLQNPLNVNGDQKEVIDNQQKLINEQTQKLNELQQKVDQLESTSKNEVIEKTTTPQTTKSNTTENLDLILTNYKIDSQNGSNFIDMILTDSYNSPKQFCQGVIANKTTRQHFFYIVYDQVNSLENRYGKYRTKIEYIKNNLDGKWGIISMVQDRCKAVGLNIE